MAVTRNNRSNRLHSPRLLKEGVKVAKKLIRAKRPLTHDEILTLLSYCTLHNEPITFSAAEPDVSENIIRDITPKYTRKADSFSVEPPDKDEYPMDFEGEDFEDTPEIMKVCRICLIAKVEKDDFYLVRPGSYRGECMKCVSQKRARARKLRNRKLERGNRATGER